MAPVKVLIVDDDDALRRSMARSLTNAGYECLEADSSEQARARMNSESDVAAVLCDIRLPSGSGLDLLRELVADHPDVAVLMTTGVGDPEVALSAFDIGAAGYLVKPFETNELLINLAVILRRRDLERAHLEHVRFLEHALTRVRALTRVLDIDDSGPPSVGDKTIDRLTRALPLKNEETPNHVERVSRSAELLAAAVGPHAWSSDTLLLSAALHDVGKIGVPDAILLKAGRLTPEENATMQRHTQFGYQLLAGSASTAVRAAAEVALAHHEWWDGSGYPLGLSGEEIPEAARITAVVEVFDALTSDRVYRSALPPDAATRIMTEGRGTQFEPRLLDAFLNIVDEVIALRSSFPDKPDAERRIRVLVVDDHEMVRESLVRVLDTRSDLMVVGTAGTVAEARVAVDTLEPDVVVMDLQLPDGDGADATRQVKALAPGVRVVMLTGRTDDEAMVRAIAAGCSGFVTKTDALEKLVDAVVAAVEGDDVAPAAELSRLLTKLRPTHRGRGARLSAREVEVLGLMATGLINKQIARHLGLSLHTVRNHVQNILTKLEAHSRLEAVVTGVREGVIASPSDTTHL